VQQADSFSVGTYYFRNRPFRLLWSGHTVSSLGDWVATFGLMLYVRDLTRGSDIEGLAISGILGFRILPALIAAPIASSIADRFDRRRTMITTDILRAGLIAAVPFTPNLGAVYAVAFVLEGLSLVFLPARDAVVPNLVPPKQLAGANALIMLTQWGTIPIAGGLVVASEAGARALLGTPVIGRLAEQRFALPFFFDAATFLVSAWAIAALPAHLGKVAREPKAAIGHNPLHAMQTDMAEGTRYLFHERGLRGLILGMALATGAGGALFSLGIPYVKSTLGASDSVFGALIALWGVGMAIGAYASQRSKRREADLFRLALGGCGAILVLMAMLPWTWLALVLAVGFGAGLSIALVLGITLAQRTAPPRLRGRVMAAVHVLARIFLILGAVVVGGAAAVLDRIEILGGWDGNRYAFVLAGVTMMAGGTAAKGGAVHLEEDAVRGEDDGPD
jgi:dTMP kinase